MKLLSPTMYDVVENTKIQFPFTMREWYRNSCSLPQTSHLHCRILHVPANVRLLLGECYTVNGCLLVCRVRFGTIRWYAYQWQSAFTQLALISEFRQPRGSYHSAYQSHGCRFYSTVKGIFGNFQHATAAPLLTKCDGRLISGRTFLQTPNRQVTYFFYNKKSQLGLYVLI